MTLSLHRAREVEAQTKEPAKEPARAWKNRWLCVGHVPNFGCTTCGLSGSKSPGDEVISCHRVWPTADDARKHAAEAGGLNDFSSRWRYLGPIPVTP